MIKSKMVVSILFLFSGVSISEAQILFRDSLYQEFRYFTNLLEKTHPDPYSGFGGKVEFHKESYTIQQELKTNDYTLGQYQNVLTSFISRLRDGHSCIFNNQTVDVSRALYIPLSLKTIPEGLIIKGLPSVFTKYLGSRLVAINGIPLDALCKRISQISPSENKYGEYKDLEYMLFNPSKLNQLFPDLKNKNSVSIKIQTPENKEKEILLNLTENKEWYLIDFSQLSEQSKLIKSEYLYFDFVDETTVYLRMKSVMARENFLATQQQKWPSFENQLRDFYQWTLKKEMPENIDEAVSELLCYAEIFRTMLTEMKEKNTRNLIIDLRGNRGGWTPITLPTLYMLYGDEYLDKYMDTHYYQMVSPLLLKKKGISLDQFNHNNGSDYQYGDYIFNNSTNRDLMVEEKRSMFVDRAIGDGGKYIKDLKGKPIYTPENIYVITDAITFSAAFHYAFYLWKMGATVVGVPSSQAPNTYMEMTEFELPYTKLKGSISNSVQYYLSVNDRRAKTFWPDLMPEYHDYKKYNFDPDTEVLWLLDYIKNK